MLYLDSTGLDWALAHTAKHGDTDILPTPFEFQAIQHDWIDIREFLLNQNILEWRVRPHRVLLAPKARYGFRVVTQLDPLDLLVFAALVRDIADDIEAQRAPIQKEIVFSYRVKLQKDGQLFDPDIGFNNFGVRADALLGKKKHSHIALADIADLYPRIYHHRLENALSACTSKANHVRAIMNLLSGWNGTETFGIPVGNQFSRLLAEALLIDVDSALLAGGVTFIRYNDDYRIFASDHAEAYRHLAFLADVLYKNHGLTLQPQKTKVLTRSVFRKRFGTSPEQREFDSMVDKFEQLIEELELSDSYEPIDYDDLNEDQQALIDSLNLQQLFLEEAEADSPDFMLLRFVLRRMAQIGDSSLADSIFDKLDKVYPAFPYIVEYLKSLRDLEEEDYHRIGGKVLDALESSIISELEFHRMWGLDLFSASTQWNHSERFFRMFGSANDEVTRRKLILAMGRAHQRHWFQTQWRNLFNEGPWPKRALIAAASCLPADGRKHWYKSIASRLDPLETAVMKWAKANPF